MRKFKFRLGSVLKLREAARDQRRAELAEVYRADDTLRQHAADIDRELLGNRAHCRAAVGPGALDVDRLLEGHRYELLLRSQRRQIDAQRAMLAIEIERRRLLLVQASRDVRVLEKLRQRQSDHHRAEEARQLMKQLDEIAQQRADQSLFQNRPSRPERPSGPERPTASKVRSQEALS